MGKKIPNGTYKSGQYTDKQHPGVVSVSTAVVEGAYLTLTTAMNGTNCVNRGSYQINGSRLTLAGETYSFSIGANGFYLDGIWLGKP